MFSGISALTSMYARPVKHEKMNRSRVSLKTFQMKRLFHDGFDFILCEVATVNIVHVEMDSKIRVIVEHAHLDAVEDDGTHSLHRLHSSVVALIYDCRKIDVVILNNGRVEARGASYPCSGTLPVAFP